MTGPVSFNRDATVHLDVVDHMMSSCSFWSMLAYKRIRHYAEMQRNYPNWPIYETISTLRELMQYLENAHKELDYYIENGHLNRA